jgi:type II secretory pathway component PulK
MPSRPASASLRRPRAALIVVVLVSLAFTAAALGYFMQKAATDLIAATREADAHRLRGEAYAALESTLAVLAAFRAAGGPWRSPAEGWGEPLAWTDYQPAEGREVRVSLVDESGKIPLARVDFETLRRVFESWDLDLAEAERLADALLDWMREGHVRRGFRGAMEGDYERAILPFRAPRRPLRGWAELAAIDGLREVFTDDRGRLNALGERFETVFSRWDYARPNVNAATPEVLAAVGDYRETQLRQLDQYRTGEGIFGNRRAATSCVVTRSTR